MVELPAVLRVDESELVGKDPRNKSALGEVMVHFIVFFGVSVIVSVIVQAISHARAETKRTLRLAGFRQDLLNSTRTGVVAATDLRKLAESHQIDEKELLGVLSELQKDMLTNKVQKCAFALRSIDQFTAQLDTDELLRELPPSVLVHAHRVLDRIGSECAAFNDMLREYNKAFAEIGRERQALADHVEVLAPRLRRWRVAFSALSLLFFTLAFTHDDVQRGARALSGMMATWFERAAK